MTKNRIRHMVIFNLRHELSPPEVEKFLVDGLSLLTSIPGVEHFEVLRQVSPKNDYDFGFSMEFSDQATYDVYNNHPTHTSFVNERWDKEVSRFFEIDFSSSI